MTNGISISYRGTDIRFASDYAKSIDSRWKFMEVAYEGDKIMTMPAIAASGDTSKGFEQSFEIIKHDFNFYPFYECSVAVVEGLPLSSQSGESFGGFTLTTFNPGSTKNSLYIFPRYQYDIGQSPIKIRIQYRVYNINIDEEYVAPLFGQPAANAGSSGYGVKMLDGTQPIDVSSKSVEGFSIDTTMKTLSIHSIHTQYVDDTNQRISHTVGYPPTYFICRKAEQIFQTLPSDYNIPHRDWYVSGPRFEPLARITAGNDFIDIKGVQAVFQGTYCFIILKDPVEIAK